MRLDTGWRDDLGTGHVHDMDDAGPGTVVFEFATADSRPDGYRSSWAPHCFARSFQKNPHPVMKYDHGLSGYPIPIGSAIRTESLADRARVVNVFARTPAAQDVRSLLRDHHLTGCSFHFKDGVHEPHPTLRNHIRYRSATMLESGPVLSPSSIHNVVVGVRSAPLAREGIDPADIKRMFRIFNRDSDRREVMAILAERESGIRSDERGQDMTPSAMVERIEDILARR